MKSIRESLGWSKSKSGLDASPKSAAGILSHNEEKKLNDLWIEITKSEDGFKKLHSELDKYQASIRSVQESDEKLINRLGDSNIGAFSPDFCKILDEYLSFIMETKEKNEEIAFLLQGTVCEGSRHYHSLYDHLDTIRRKRDTAITEIHKCQEKLDRLKLKGKRTTDMIVEKDKMSRNLKDLHNQIVDEGTLFHELRVPLIELFMLTLIQAQMDYYGTAASELNSHIHLSRGHSSLKDTQYSQTIDQHFGRIKNLKIVKL